MKRSMTTNQCKKEPFATDATQLHDAKKYERYDSKNWHFFGPKKFLIILSIIIIKNMEDFNGKITISLP